MKFNSRALIGSVVGVIWLIVAITLLSEVSESFKSFLTQVAGHHWTGKSIITAAAFVVFYVLLRKSEESKDILLGAFFVVGSVILGGLVIFLYFLQHFIRG